MHTKMKTIVVLAAALLSPIVGGAQAEKRAASAEKKPTVLVVYADWCPMCQKLKPVISAIADKYRGKIRFVRYDITSKSTETQSKMQAEKLGFEDFFVRNRESTSLVVILDSAGREELRTHADYDPEHYEAVLDRLLVAARDSQAPVADEAFRKALCECRITQVIISRLLRSFLNTHRSAWPGRG